MSGKKWEHFNHQADIGVRGYGASMGECFANAAAAMTAVITDVKITGRDEAAAIECECDDAEVLLADWLNAVVYEMAVRGAIFGEFEVEISGGKLRGWARGEKMDAGRHEMAVEVKGATYTELKVFQGDDGVWVGQCVVDV